MVLPYGWPTPPPVDTPTVWVGTYRQTPLVELIGANGDTLNLTGDGLHGFSIMEERGIFAAPIFVPRMLAGAGEGARYMGSRADARTVDLKLDVKGDDVDDLARLLARLAAVILDPDQPAWLRVTPRTGGSVKARWLPVVYNGGWDGSGSGFEYLQVPLALVSPEPYWLGVHVEEPEPWVVHSAKGLLGTIPFFPVRLGQSQVLGELPLTNPGDIAAYAAWTLTGPGGPISVRPAPGARGFTITSELDPGQVLVASRAAGETTLKEEDGTDRYELYGPAPLVWRIPPGASIAHVEVLSAQAGTAVALRYVPRYRLGV